MEGNMNKVEMDSYFNAVCYSASRWPARGWFAFPTAHVMNEIPPNHRSGSNDAEFLKKLEGNEISGITYHLEGCVEDGLTGSGYKFKVEERLWRTSTGNS